MDADDALKIADIIADADGGCPVCVNRLVKTCIERFPEHTEIFMKKFDEDTEKLIDSQRPK
jgi:hypothetical protein